MLKFKYAIGQGAVTIRFDAKPAEPIRAMLKANGFRWAPGSGEWWRSRIVGAADFLTALERALNPDRPDGACWECKDPKGFFRPYGAATPVYCDACHAAHLQREQIRTAPRPDRFDMDFEGRCKEACGL